MLYVVIYAHIPHLYFEYHTKYYLHIHYFLVSYYISSLIFYNVLCYNGYSIITHCISIQYHYNA